MTDARMLVRSLTCWLGWHAWRTGPWYDDDRATRCLWCGVMRAHATRRDAHTHADDDDVMHALTRAVATLEGAQMGDHLQGRTIGKYLVAEGLCPPHARVVDVVITSTEPVLIRYEVYCTGDDLAKLARAMQAAAVELRVSHA